MKVFSVDPGEEKGVGQSGWCYQDETKVFAMGETQDLPGFLANWDIVKLPIDQVVVEGYIINPRQDDRIKANIGKELITVENIGVVKMFARLHNLPLTKYMNTLKPVQAKHTGVFPKKMRKDISHKFDAFNHGWWLLYQHKLVKSKLEKEMEAKGLL